ncbi:MAG: class I SAM-dependent methyltransferase [Anaerolineae bacterium]|nr:class I SAM-dependent methyltransferase [Anaerolineae bacterium]
MLASQMKDTCPICGGAAYIFGHADVLGKFKACYRRCQACGFIYPEDPIWLDEAYSDAITRSDIGLISRNALYARITAVLIAMAFDPHGKFIDYGGGYGMFVRMMRDAGFDFYRQDKFCENLFAQQFEAEEIGSGQYELLTSFEVFEHLTNPVPEIETMLSYSRNILFSTVLVPDPAPALGTWWYYGLEHGQHVALYTYQALQLVARRFGLHFYTDGRALHLFSEKKLPSRLFALAARPRIATVLSFVFRRPSLLQADYAKLTGQEIR